MNKNEKFVITINRELGSGGRTVGRKLAEKLNVAFYDKELINELKEKFHLDTEQIEKLKSGKNDWWREFINSALYMGQGMNEMWYYNRMTGKEGYLVTSNDMFQQDKEILTKVAEEDSCIIAGRSGFSVFANHPNHLSILIQAPFEHRVQRIMGKQNLSREEAEKVINEIDSTRDTFVKNVTDTARHDAHNYDFVLNVTGMNPEQVTDFLADIVTYKLDMTR